MKVSGFTIRVYGLFIHREMVLLSREFRLGIFMTKFLGGGLIPGEGIADCLRREIREEMNQEITILKHLYTTDFFQASINLHPPFQIINVYYLGRLAQPDGLMAVNDDMMPARVDGSQIFIWKRLKDLQQTDLSLPIDKHFIGLFENGDIDLSDLK